MIGQTRAIALIVAGLFSSPVAAGLPGFHPTIAPGLPGLTIATGTAHVIGVAQSPGYYSCEANDIVHLGVRSNILSSAEGHVATLTLLGDCYGSALGSTYPGNWTCSGPISGDLVCGLSAAFGGITMEGTLTLSATGDIEATFSRDDPTGSNSGYFLGVHGHLL